MGSPPPISDGPGSFPPPGSDPLAPPPGGGAAGAGAAAPAGAICDAQCKCPAPPGPCECKDESTCGTSSTRTSNVTYTITGTPTNIDDPDISFDESGYPICPGGPTTSVTWHCTSVSACEINGMSCNWTTVNPGATWTADARDVSCDEIQHGLPAGCHCDKCEIALPPGMGGNPIDCTAGGGEPTATEDWTNGGCKAKFSTCVDPADCKTKDCCKNWTTKFECTVTAPGSGGGKMTCCHDDNDAAACKADLFCAPPVATGGGGTTGTNGSYPESPGNQPPAP